MCEIIMGLGKRGDVPPSTLPLRKQMSGYHRERLTSFGTKLVKRVRQATLPKLEMSSHFISIQDNINKGARSEHFRKSFLNNEMVHEFRDVIFPEAL